MQKVEIDNNEIEAGAELGSAQYSWSWIRLTEAGSSGVVSFIVSKAKRYYICMCEVNIKLDKIGLLLCHSHIELRLRLRLCWGYGWIEVDIEAEVKMRLSRSLVEIELR